MLRAAPRTAQCVWCTVRNCANFYEDNQRAWARSQWRVARSETRHPARRSARCRVARRVPRCLAVERYLHVRLCRMNMPLIVICRMLEWIAKFWVNTSRLPVYYESLEPSVAG